MHQSGCSGHEGRGTNEKQELKARKAPCAFCYQDSSKVLLELIDLCQYGFHDLETLEPTFYRPASYIPLLVRPVAVKHSWLWLWIWLWIWLCISNSSILSIRHSDFHNHSDLLITNR
jgi:hypothetical protein